MEIVEYRGIEGLVAAEITKDDTTGYTAGTPFAVAGVAEISKSTDSSSEAHYYDNIPAIIIQSEGPDTININVSAIPLDVLAKLTGQMFDIATGTLIEEPRTPKYFAIGYIAKKTNGDLVYVWRLKGTFAIPDQTNATEDNSTNANGQTLVYTGIPTQYVFTKNHKPAKAVNVDVARNLCDVTSFFTAVTTPDTLVAKTTYTLTITEAASTDVVVKRNGVTLPTGSTISAGDQLQISVTGGTITVNSSDFISGDIHVVSGNVTVVSTAS